MLALNDPEVAVLADPPADARVGAELAGDKVEVAPVVMLEEGEALEGAIPPTADPAPTALAGMGLGALRLLELYPPIGVPVLMKLGGV